MTSRGLTFVLLLAVLLGSCTDDGKPGTEQPADERVQVITELAQAWSDVDAAAFAQLTDAPRDARAAFRSMAEELQLESADVATVGEPTCDDTRCAQSLEVTLQVGGIGPWTYQTEASTDASVVAWEPALLHPRLRAKLALDRTREVPPRALILDRDGERLVSNLPVWHIGVVPAKAGPGSYDRLAQLLDIDAAALAARARDADPDLFLPVITLRRSDYAPLRPQLLEVPGIAIDPDRLPLAPTAGWGRAVLGTVLPATAESLRNAGPLAVAADSVGSTGLQYAYERQLAGTPGGTVSLIDRDGRVRATLWQQRPTPGDDLRTTLDVQVQAAAERAVVGQTKTTVLVAVQADTGEVLASAIGPEVTSYNTAFIGQYPPGSTFKVVSTAALIEAGQDIGAPAQCPSTTVIDGKRFKNYDFTSLPSGATFADTIAASCNTTVVERADELDDDSVSTTATDSFGIGAEWELALDAYSGSVPPSSSLVDRAASMIGQGRVLMSPLGMAMVAATVRSGTARVPTLVPADDPGGETGSLPSSVAGDLRQIMRMVVTQGTATSLRGLPGGVAAKTGTAEYGTADPPRTHGWMIGYRDDLAFACLVVDGAGGNSDAGPVVRRFLESVPLR